MYFEINDNILTEGIPVFINEKIKTTAVLGKYNAVEKLYNILYYKKGLFLPDIPLEAGDIIKIPIENNKNYLVLAVRKDIIGGEIIANIAYFMETNQTVKVQRQKKEFSDQGRTLSTGFSDLFIDVPVAIEYIEFTAAQDRVGLLAEATYRMYVKKDLDVKQKDRILFNDGTALEVITVDPFLIPNISVVNLRPDNRSE